MISTVEELRAYETEVLDRINKRHEEFNKYLESVKIEHESIQDETSRKLAEIDRMLDELIKD